MKNKQKIYKKEKIFLRTFIFIYIYLFIKIWQKKLVFVFEEKTQKLFNTIQTIFGDIFFVATKRAKKKNVLTNIVTKIVIHKDVFKQFLFHKKTFSFFGAIVLVFFFSFFLLFSICLSVSWQKVIEQMLGQNNLKLELWLVFIRPSEINRASQ